MTELTGAILIQQHLCHTLGVDLASCQQETPLAPSFFQQFIAGHIRRAVDLIAIYDRLVIVPVQQLKQLAGKLFGIRLHSYLPRR